MYHHGGMSTQSVRALMQFMLTPLNLRADCDALAQGFPHYDRRRPAAAATAVKDSGDQQLTARQLCRSDPGAAIRVLLIASPVTHYAHIERPKQLAAVLVGTARWLMQ